MFKRRNGDDADARKGPGPRKAKDTFAENVRTLVYALAIALFIRTFLVQAFRIPSGSMEETLLIGDFLLVDKVTFGANVPGTDWRLPGFRKPHRGDILVFKDPVTNRDFIKRCIGQGGETLKVVNNEVHIDGQPLTEPYKHVGPGSLDLANFPYRTAARQELERWVAADRMRRGIALDSPMPDGYRIPDDRIFMMGDNRNNSSDSRAWGSLEQSRVVGRAFVLYWSSDPDHAPRWVRNLPENWVKGFFQLFLGKPRLRRLGTWLAHDYSDIYDANPHTAVAAPGNE